MWPVDPLQRTCTELMPDEDNGAARSSQAPAPVITVRELAETPVFVLLGEPGMGKSETMKALATLVLGEQGKPIAANDFIVLPASPHNAERPVFIDALDEARAGGDTTVWRELRRSIAHSGLTHFGVSCRVADWQGTDTQDLATVAQGQRIRVFALNPLTPEQRHAVLKDEAIEDPDNFEQQAEALGFGDMLGNPQSLKLLGASVKENQNQWPQNRRDAYELACQALLREANQHHRQAQQSAALLSDEALLDAAGWLCALMLLSNQNEVTDETLGTAAPEGVRLTEVLDALPANGFPTDAIRQVLQRRLFTKPRGYAATHRTVAEYLAARHITQRIAQGGLLAGRVAALMLAPSQHLVTNLRGLAGWLAALSGSMRALVFEADPSAVLNYGDLSLLSPTDKQVLIQQLESNPKVRHDTYHWKQAPAHVPLVQSDMTDFVLNWLDRLSQAPPLSARQYMAADVLLSALIHAPANPAWEPTLLAVVNQASLAEGIRSMALLALFTHRKHSSTLVGLLDAINQGTLADSNGRLLNDLLMRLYPEHILPSSLLEYLKPSQHRAGIAIMPTFWGYYIQRQTPPGLLLDLMEAIERAQKDGLFSRESFLSVSHGLEGLTALIVAAIEQHGQSASVERLARWLWLCTDRDTSLYRHLETSANERLHQWHKDHPEQIKRVLVHLVEQGRTSWDAQNRFLLNDLPPAMGAFWLEQVNRFQTIGDEAKAKECLETARWWVEQENGGITLEDLEKAVEHNSSLQTALNTWLTSPLDDTNWRRKHWLQNQKHIATQAARREVIEANLLYLLDHLADVRSGKLLSYLSDAAWIDLRESGYAGAFGSQPIAEWRQAHPDLDDATRQGYRSLLMQLTPAQAEKAIQVRKASEMLNIELPCLVAAQQLYADEPSQFFDLGQDRLQALVQIFLLQHTSDTAWFLDLAQHLPDWTEGLWWELCEKHLRAKKEIRIPRIDLLRHEARLKPMAKRLLPRILLKWPSKISEVNFSEFAQVLEHTLQVCPAHEVCDLVNTRLTRKALDSLQTGYLLMAGLWVDHQHFAPRLLSLFHKKQVIQTELLGFVHHLRRYGGQPDQLPDWDASTIGLLFKLFGPLCSTERPEGAHWVGKEDDGRVFLHQILAALRDDTSEASTNELRALRADATLEHWWPIIEDRLERQAFARAEKAFTLPTARQVALTLQNRTPANPSDLMAIALNALHALQQTLRNSDTNRLNRFWTVDTAGKRPIPPHRPEPACRDAIAEWLRADLSAMDITVSIENQHGSQNQSDIVLRVRTPAHEDMLLPIEIKGDWNRDLWTAATEQLARQYASEPRCHGQGIYLVLWLGSNRGEASKAKPHPNHPTHTPADLQTRLQLEVNQKTSAQNIRVVVLDVSIPD